MSKKGKTQVDRVEADYDAKMLLESLAIQVKRIMRERRLTRRDVAERAGVAVEFVDDFLECRINARGMELGALVDLADALGFQVSVSTVSRTLNKEAP